MEMIVISDSKLKVMLSSEDMSRFRISCDTINYDNTETRRAFWNILDEAKHRTGFDAARDRIYVQVYPSKSGGCEMYVTKLEGEGNEKHVLSVEQSHCEAWRFSSLECLLSVCRILSFSGFSAISSAYFDDKLYYLALDIQGGAEDTYSKVHGCLSEYGRAVDSLYVESYLNEHCTPICKNNAVEVLSALS